MVERSRKFSFSPNGKFLYAHGDGGKLSVWETASRVLKFTIEKKLNTVLFSPDEKSIFIATKREGQIINSQTGTVIARLDKDVISVRFARWSPNSQYLAVEIADFSLGLFDAASGKLKNSFLTHERKKKKLAISRLFDFPYIATTVLFTLDSRRVLTINDDPNNDDPNAEMWDIETGNLVFTLTHKFSYVEFGKIKTKQDRIWLTEISQDGKWIVSSDYSNSCLWNADTGEIVRKFEGDSDLRFIDDSRYLGLISEKTSQATFILDLVTMKTRQLFSKYSGTHPVWGPDGRLVLTNRTREEVSKKEAYIWDFETGKQLATIRTYAKHCFDLVSTCISDSDDFTFSPNSKVLLSANNTQVKLLDPQNGNLLLEIPDAEGPAFWSPDGKLILAKDIQKGKIGLWRVKEK
ncbi:MAG: WD40 repeat domain-containing protein [Pyrinomonadaceae bacterium]